MVFQCMEMAARHCVLTISGLFTENILREWLLKHGVMNYRAYMRDNGGWVRSVGSLRSGKPNINSASDKHSRWVRCSRKSRRCWTTASGQSARTRRKDRQREWPVRCRGWCSSGRSARRLRLSDFATSPTRRRRCFDVPSGSCCWSPGLPSPPIRSRVESSTISPIR